MPSSIVEDKPTSLPNIIVSDKLIYEELDGVKYYRKDYKEVINHAKTIEEIMGEVACKEVSSMSY